MPARTNLDGVEEGGEPFLVLGTDVRALLHQQAHHRLVTTLRRYHEGGHIVPVSVVPGGLLAAVGDRLGKLEQQQQQQ